MARKKVKKIRAYYLSKISSSKISILILKKTTSKVLMTTSAKRT